MEGLEGTKPLPVVAWNRIPEEHRAALIWLALDKPELSPREIAVSHTDEQAYYVSESTVYRLLKAQDLITSPSYILMSAAEKFQHPSRRVNELWLTDFTYFKIVGRGWYYLSTVLDDYSRFIIAWRLCTSISASDVSDTLDDARRFTHLDEVRVQHRPRLLRDNGQYYLSVELAGCLKEH